MSNSSPIGGPNFISSYKDMLNISWEKYKATMIEEDGRPLANKDISQEAENNDVDKDGNTEESVTHSEAVSYVLLRAAIMKDQPTFDKTWKWAQAHLQRKNIGQLYDPNWKKWVDYKKFTNGSKSDYLFAWRWMPSLIDAKHNVKIEKALKEIANTKDKDAQINILKHALKGLVSEVDMEKYEKKVSQLLSDIISVSEMEGKKKFVNEAVDLGGVLSTYDFDPASDADQDIAAALLIMKKNFQGKPENRSEVNYYQEAMNILGDIWNKEVDVVAGMPVMLAGDNYAYSVNPVDSSKTFGVNPSYFRPFYYKTLFASFDPYHDWSALYSSSYKLLEEAQNANVHNEYYQIDADFSKMTGTNGFITKDANGNEKRSNVNLVPDFMALDAKTGKVVDFGWEIGDHKAKDYFSGADAFRTHFWIAMSRQLDPNDKLAQDYCSPNGRTSPFPFLMDELGKNKTIYSEYMLDGTPKTTFDKLRALGVYTAYLWTVEGKNDDLAGMFKKIDGSFNSQDGLWESGDLDKDKGWEKYYDQNWMWFSLALMTGDIKEAFSFTSEDTNAPENFLGLNTFGSWFTKAKNLAFSFNAKEFPAARKRGELRRTLDNLPVGDLEREINVKNSNLISRAEYYKNREVFDEAYKCLDRVVQQNWGANNAHVPKYNEAMYKRFEVYMAEIEYLSNSRGELLELTEKYKEKLDNNGKYKDRYKDEEKFGTLTVQVNNIAARMDKKIQEAKEMLLSGVAGLRMMEEGQSGRYYKELINLAAFSATIGKDFKTSFSPKRIKKIMGAYKVLVYIKANGTGEAQMIEVNKIMEEHGISKMSELRMIMAQQDGREAIATLLYKKQDYNDTDMEKMIKLSMGKVQISRYLKYVTGIELSRVRVSKMRLVYQVTRMVKEGIKDAEIMKFLANKGSELSIEKILSLSKATDIRQMRIKLTDAKIPYADDDAVTKFIIENVTDEVRNELSGGDVIADVLTGMAYFTGIPKLSVYNRSIKEQIKAVYILKKINEEAKKEGNTFDMAKVDEVMKNAGIKDADALDAIKGDPIVIEAVDVLSEAGIEYKDDSAVDEYINYFLALKERISSTDETMPAKYDKKKVSQMAAVYMAGKLPEDKRAEADGILKEAGILNWDEYKTLADKRDFSDMTEALDKANIDPTNKGSIEIFIKSKGIEEEMNEYYDVITQGELVPVQSIKGPYNNFVNGLYYDNYMAFDSFIDYAQYLKKAVTAFDNRDEMIIRLTALSYLDDLTGENHGYDKYSYTNTAKKYDSDAHTSFMDFRRGSQLFISRALSKAPGINFEVWNKIPLIRDEVNYIKSFDKARVDVFQEKLLMGLKDLYLDKALSLGDSNTPEQEEYKKRVEALKMEIAEIDSYLREQAEKGLISEDYHLKAQKYIQGKKFRRE